MVYGHRGHLHLVGGRPHVAPHCRNGLGAQRVGVAQRAKSECQWQLWALLSGAVQRGFDVAADHQPDDVAGTCQVCKLAVGSAGDAHRSVGEAVEPQAPSQLVASVRLLGCVRACVGGPLGGDVERRGHWRPEPQDSPGVAPRNDHRVHQFTVPPWVVWDQALRHCVGGFEGHPAGSNFPQSIRCQLYPARPPVPGSTVVGEATIVVEPVRNRGLQHPEPWLQS